MNSTSTRESTEFVDSTDGKASEIENFNVGGRKGVTKQREHPKKRVKAGRRHIQARVEERRTKKIKAVEKKEGTILQRHIVNDTSETPVKRSKQR